MRAFSPAPLFFEKGEGCRATDADGNVYVDMCMAYGPLIGGHACPESVAAALKQMPKGTVYGAPSVPELDLIKRLCGIVPSMDMVRLASSGTEATMHAIRLARGFSGKDGIVKMKGGFHGAHDAVLVKAGSGSAECLPGSAGVPADAVRNTRTVEYNDASAMESLLDGDEGIGCIIMEPVMGNVGVVPPEKGYLDEVKRIAASHGAVLIFDEVISGCRLSPGGAQEMFGTTPDMTTMAKIIGGGFPAGAFGGRREIMEMVAPAGPVYAAGTFSGNPVSAAAGLATIDMMMRPGAYDRLNKRSADLAGSLRDSLADSGVKGCVNCVGSMMSVFFGLDRVTNGTEAAGTDRGAFDRLFRFMLKRGVYLPPSALEVWFMSVAHDDDGVRLVSESFADFLKEERK